MGRVTEKVTWYGGFRKSPVCNFFFIWNEKKHFGNSVKKSKQRSFLPRTSTLLFRTSNSPMTYPPDGLLPGVSSDATLLWPHAIRPLSRKTQTEFPQVFPGIEGNQKTEKIHMKKRFTYIIIIIIVDNIKWLEDVNILPSFLCTHFHGPFLPSLIRQYHGF